MVCPVDLIADMICRREVEMMQDRNARLRQAGAQAEAKADEQFEQVRPFGSAPRVRDREIVNCRQPS
jgi:hypothetical protein